VYWTRRLVLLVLVLGLVYGTAHLVGGGGIGFGGQPAARPVVSARSHSPSYGPTPSAGTSTGSPTGQGRHNGRPGHGANGKAHHHKSSTPTKTPLAQPTGTCADSDVNVTPSVHGPAYAGQRVMITLNLTTVQSPACTWEVSPRSVAVKITSGPDRVWSTQDCAAWMPTRSVVVRKDHVHKVRLGWNAQRSVGSCSRSTPWAQPGYYHAEAAALGSPHPLDVQFELTSPPRPTITASPTPKNGSKTP
jgi:hypothetical protein